MRCHADTAQQRRVRARGILWGNILPQMQLRTIRNYTPQRRKAVQKRSRKRSTHIAIWLSACNHCISVWRFGAYMGHQTHCSTHKALRQAGRIGWNPLPPLVGGGGVCV